MAGVKLLMHEPTISTALSRKPAILPYRCTILKASARVTAMWYLLQGDRDLMVQIEIVPIRSLVCGLSEGYDQPI